MTTPLDVPSNTIMAYVVPGVTHDVSQSIRPCKITRDWMDATPARYAYRCIPLTAANSMGWEILNPVDTEIVWDGKEKGDQLHFKVQRADPFAARPHFGGGTVTWYVPFIFRTPPDYGLIVAGPANQDKAGVVPLDAFIRTDWLSFPFTMNWRITQPDTKIVFKAGEPICRIFPYPLALLNEMKMEIRDLADDLGFMQQVQQWEVERRTNYQKQKDAEQQWAREGRKPELKELWNSQYAKGEGAENNKVKHQNMFKCEEPTNLRKK
ncbi:DUF6065 family protein [Glaciecola siphonariae]|uniref:DUF6065 family protein n=1 Tax=Glaciecola siphonariae TaxID=521012 RepID=A0ABV9LZF2_9ALTE